MLYALIPAAAFGVLVYLLLTVPLPWHLAWPWIPSLGIDLVIHIDGL